MMGAWEGVVGEYFGRVDPAAWEAAHPAPPPPPVELGKDQVEVLRTERVVPSAGLPEEVAVQRANNNLDVVRHSDGRVYLAWRTAPSHFAGAQTVIQVVSSTDEAHWRFETSFATGSDLREPRFLSLGSRLFLYLSRLGSDPFAFEPQGFSVSELEGGTFSALEPVYEPGYILWRAKTLGDRAAVVAYGGGANIYAYGDSPLTVDLLTTRDGRTFTPFNPEHPALLTGGGSETDFALGADGSLFGVVRNEAGDASGWGSKLCRAPASDITRWTCVSDPKKYDSPLVFEEDGETYVVARRNRTLDGRYDVAEGARFLHGVRNQLSYILEAKRCSLFRFVPGENRLAFVLDLPSRGDTCFPSLLRSADPSQLTIYNYSSDIDGPDLPWAAGQRQDTYIYRHVLRFSPR
jgi:hypothetical protein